MKSVQIRTRKSSVFVHFSRSVWLQIFMARSLFWFHLQSRTLKLIDSSFFVGNKQFTFSAEIDFNIKLSEKLILKNVKLTIEIGLENSVEISCSLTNSLPKLEFTGVSIRLKSSCSQPELTCSKLTIETVEWGVKYLQS